MFFEESQSSRVGNGDPGESEESGRESIGRCEVNPLKTSPSFGNRLPKCGVMRNMHNRISMKAEMQRKLAEQRGDVEAKFLGEKKEIQMKLDSLVRATCAVFNTVVGGERKMREEMREGRVHEVVQIEFVMECIKGLSKFVFENNLKKRKSREASQRKWGERVFKTWEKEKVEGDVEGMRESAPECLHTLTKGLVFRKTVLKGKHLESIVGEKKPKNKKRKRRVKGSQQSLYISNSKKRFKKVGKGGHMLKNKSCNKTKLTLNDHDFSYISNGVDIWGLTRRNKMVELSSKLQGFESGTLDKGTLFARPFPTKPIVKKNKSKAHFSLRKIGEAPSKLEWFQQIREDVKKQTHGESQSVLGGFQSNFIKLSGLRNRSINSGRVSKRSKIKKGSLNQIKQKLKLTAESGSQTNKPRRLNPKLDRRILTCFQKSPKLKSKKVSEFLVNSPQSMNSMTLLSQKIANTSEMKTWVTKLGEKRGFGSKKVRPKKGSKKVRKPKDKDKEKEKGSKKGSPKSKGERGVKKGLKLKSLWNERPQSKNLVLKIANTTKGKPQHTISFLKIFSTKNGNEVNFDKKTTKLWELFKKQKDKQKKKSKGKVGTKEKSPEEGNKFYYDDSNFNSFTKQEHNKAPRKASKKKKAPKKADLHIKNFFLSEDFCNQILGGAPVFGNNPSSKRLEKSKFVSSRVLALPLPKENFSPNLPDSKQKCKKSKIKFKT
jgi:hypothetical protein